MKTICYPEVRWLSLWENVKMSIDLKDEIQMFMDGKGKTSC